MSAVVDEALTAEEPLVSDEATPAAAEPTKTVTVAAAVEDDDDDPWSASNRKYKWRSGHCGMAPCHDGQIPAPGGETPRRCLHVGINGVRASTPYTVCACECHDGQELPDMTSIVAEWQAAQKG